MQLFVAIIASLVIIFGLITVAQVSVDRITVRDCARGIKGACEEVERLNLK